jgi:uncharacterized protein YhaN
VNSQIYGAGIGAAKLPLALRTIKDRKTQFFRNRGTSLVADSIAQLREIDSKIEESRGNAAAYGDLVTQLSDIKRELDSAVMDRTRLQQMSGDNERLHQAWADWVSLVDIEDRLVKLPPLDGFPEDAVARLERDEGRVADAKHELEAVVKSLDEANKSAQVEIPGEEILLRQDQIERVRRGRDGFDGSVRDLPERKAEQRNLEHFLSERLRDLGPDWDEARLDSFDSSIAFQNYIDQAKEVLARSAASVRQRTDHLEQANERLRERREAEQHARQQLEDSLEPPLDAGSLEQKRTALRATRTRLEEFTRLRQRHADLRDQLDSTPASTAHQRRSNFHRTGWLPLIMGLIGVLLFAAGAVLGPEALVIGGISGLLLLGAAAYILVNGNREAGTATPALQVLLHRVEEAGSEATNAEAALRVIARDLGLDLPDAVALNNTEGAIDAAGRVLATWENLSQQLQDSVRAVQQQEGQVEAAAQSRAYELETQGSSLSEWRAWLTGRGLADSFAPETMVELRGHVETGRVELDQVREKRHRVKAIEEDIDEYWKQIEPLAKEFSIPLVTGDPAQFAVAADHLIARYDKVRQIAEERDINRNISETIRHQVQQRQDRLEEAQGILQRLLEVGGTQDLEQFRRLAAQHRERRELEREQHQHVLRLQQLSGPGEELERFKKALAHGNPQSLADSLRELAEKIEINEESQHALAEKQGQVRTLLGQLTSEEESSALRVSRNVAIEQLREYAQEWSKLTVAEELLLGARRKFEEERQPGVIQHAQKFFGVITDQRYSRLYAPIGEQTVTVIDQTGAAKQPTELSRGTREQLYLALRFGLIREFGKRTESLPVVVDEVLVNFDPVRAQRAASAFAELAQTNQVLVFTCHPETVALFTGAAPDTEVIEI